MRMGVEPTLLTYLEAGRVAEEAGAPAVALHARTAAQLYSGRADWSAIARLKQHLSIPVLGNGDIWEAADAIAHAAGHRGRRRGDRPGLPRPAVAVRRPGRRLRGPAPRPGPAAGRGDGGPGRARPACWPARRGEHAGLRDLRKHTGWYLAGYPVGPAVRRRSGAGRLPRRAGGAWSPPSIPTISRAADAVRAPRGTQSGPQQVTLPDGWLDHRDDLVPPPAELDAAVSGG